MFRPAIADYALIGDTRTAALVSKAGSIDWMCAPNFESTPVFGQLVGGIDAGTFRVDVEGATSHHRRYVEDSAVLETEVRTERGRGRRTDVMVIDVEGRLLPQSAVVRGVRCDEGNLHVRILFDPKHGLPGRSPRVSRRSGVLVCEWGSLAATLQTFPSLDIEPGKEVTVDLPASSELLMVMGISDRVPAVFVSEYDASALANETVTWWRRWSQTIEYDGPFRDAVIRSLITLQLLTFSPSGAPVAAPTTSLPEQIGGSRNWDYRFSWPRDASIGLAAFLAVNRLELAHSFMHWLLHASRLTRPRLKVLYTLYGKSPRGEYKVDGAPGYQGSLPVRIGNDARDQHQLDVYGWVADAAWLLTKEGHRLHGETWRAISGLADYVADHWQEPDAGIWEVRGEPRHNVHSKLMGWLCLDRALKIAETRKTPRRREAKWRCERGRLRDSVIAHGFDSSVGSYIRSYGERELDAALLILPVLGFDDHPERVQGTIEAIRRELSDGELVFRYHGDDGLQGEEGAFLPCSFWLIQALAQTGRHDEATQLFERLLSRSNDVGLFSEEMDSVSGELLGNFPQAFTHATLVQAAVSMSENG